MFEILAASFERAPWGWGVLGLMIGGFVKMWPLMKRLSMDREDKLSVRIDELEKKVEAANKVAHDAEMKLVYAINAVTLLAARVRVEHPEDASLKQAMELLRAATEGGVSGWGAKLATGLNNIRGVGED